jgi:DNA-binding FadR family transcriptional regulator
MSKELGVSVALLREQLEVAKAIGLVEVRPRTGIRRLPT